MWGKVVQQSRYEPWYAPGGTYESPRCGTLVVCGNDGTYAEVTDLTEFDMASLVTYLEERDYRHVLG